jgi:predicted NAD/FAD-binding protein
MNGTAPSLGTWLEREGFSRHFIDRLIVPQASAVWSANPDQMWSFPASFMAEFFDNHGMYSLRDRPHWRTVLGGSHSYVDTITAPWRNRVRTAAPVRRIERLADEVRIEADGCETESFDRVVIAAHSDQALRMLADPSDAEREVLGAIPYQANDAVLHTDAAMMPRRRAAWSSWNFHLAETAPARTTVTYWMNHLQRLRSERQYFLTLNRDEAIDPDKVLRRFTYDHPVYTAAGVAAQHRRPEVSGPRRTHYCGAYWGWGFHEDGVVSGLKVCEEIAAADEAAPLEEALAA